MSTTQPELESTPVQFILPTSMWDLIRANYEREFGPMPSPIKSQIIVETLNGQVTGFFGLQHAIIAGPMHVYPSERSQGVAPRLAQYMERMMEGKQVTVLIVTENERIMEIARAQGLGELPGRIFGKEID